MSPERKSVWLFLLFLIPVSLQAQQKESPSVIMLVNPSFEDTPRPSATPSGWYNCGFPSETPPDIQPGQFDVVVPAKDGSTYLGLVVRDNETYESVGQRLSAPLELNQCYEFSLDLARSELYLSSSKTSTEKANYVTPTKVRIWGGNGYCDRAEMLAQTAIITHSRWLTYNFKLTPKKGNLSYILIEVYYNQPVLFPYNGHVLIDNASPIKKVPCAPDAMPAAKPKVAKAPLNPATAPKGPKIAAATPPHSQASKPANKPEDKVPVKMERKNVKKGKVFRLEKVYFDADRYDIKPESEDELNELFNFLKENPDVVVEVGGHTNNNLLPHADVAIELSTNRAKSVADWLTSRGIPDHQVQFKGYGYTQPVWPNTSELGKRKNQRVEIKILSFN
jgi:outer membrane protein OmpA-like peptidoglycan-associated protein